MTATETGRRRLHAEVGDVGGGHEVGSEQCDGLMKLDMESGSPVPSPTAFHTRSIRLLVYLVAFGFMFSMIALLDLHKRHRQLRPESLGALLESKPWVNQSEAVDDATSKLFSVAELSEDIEELLESTEAGEDSTKESLTATGNETRGTPGSTESLEEAVRRTKREVDVFLRPRVSEDQYEVLLAFYLQAMRGKCDEEFNQKSFFLSTFDLDDDIEVEPGSTLKSLWCSHGDMLKSDAMRVFVSRSKELMEEVRNLEEASAAAMDSVNLAN
mmetsp:Transcript_8096/g.16295  ORF Transcript_8096/g.16295 Transcript_8096/m.16295 type:complete len:271 (+) Transcript_8096:67-879(+)